MSKNLTDKLTGKGKGRGIFGKVKNGLMYAGIGLASLMGYETANAIDRLVPSTYATIQAAVDAPGDGDRILISDNTYTGQAGYYNILISGKDFTIESTSLNPASCIIDCASNGRRGFIINSGSNVTLRGITVKKGYVGTAYTSPGPDIRSTLIGGAGAIIDNASATITNCIFSNNYANGPSIDDADGGAIDVINSSTAYISLCEIKDSTAGHSGGGIHVGYSYAEIDSSLIHRNTGRDSDSGGGVVFTDLSTGAITNNIIINNKAWRINRPIKGGYGAGILSMNSDPNIVNNIIMYNSTIYIPTGDQGQGGGVRFSGANNSKTPWGLPKVYNNIIYGNDSTPGENEQLMIVPPMNNPTSFPQFGGKIWEIYNNDIEGGIPSGVVCYDATSNIDLDPKFVDTIEFKLQSSSPCIDAGTDALGLDHDYFGNFRPWDGNTDGTYISDIGIHEYEFAPTVTPTPTITNTPIPPTNTFTPTQTPTNTPIPPTNTFTPTQTPTWTPTNTPTITQTPTSTITNTPTITQTPTSTITNTPTITQTPTPTITNTPTITQTSIPTPTQYLDLEGIARNILGTPVPEGLPVLGVADSDNDGIDPEDQRGNNNSLPPFIWTDANGRYRIQWAISPSWIGRQFGVEIDNTLFSPTTTAQYGYRIIDVTGEVQTGIRNWTEY
ncbi:MAG: right-handed parallel beta-helix repeat-containing protein [Nanoarchaeota archaeon]